MTYGMIESLLDTVDTAQVYQIRMLPQGKHWCLKKQCWEVERVFSRFRGP